VRLANLINKVPTAVADRPVEPVKPSNFALHTNYPNPFNPTITIRFDLDKNASIELAVYNVRGELVNIIASGYHASGSHVVNWNGKDRSDRMVPSGIYIYKLKVGETSYSRKMTLLK